MRKESDIDCFNPIRNGGFSSEKEHGTNHTENLDTSLAPVNCILCIVMRCDVTVYTMVNVKYYYVFFCGDSEIGHTFSKHHDVHRGNKQWRMFRWHRGNLNCN